MSEKQFRIIDEEFISYYGGYGYLISDGDCKFWLWQTKEESQKVCDKLNKLINENEELKYNLSAHIVDLNNYQGKCSRLEEENGQLKKENEELNSIKRFAENNGINIFKIEEAFRRCWNDNRKLINENEQLKFDKKQLHGAMSRQHVRHSQFRDKVFDLIDKKIAHYKHKPISAPISNPFNPRYDRDVDRLARLNELKELREEMMEMLDFIFEPMPPEKEIFTLEQIIQNRKKRLEIMKEMNRETEMELEKEIKELEKELDKEGLSS